MYNLRAIMIRSLSSAFVITCLCFSSICTTGFADAGSSKEKFSTEPILRIETGVHTAPIKCIDLDRDQRFVVSGSHDKTVRIWNLKTGHLLRTLRVPLGDGLLGKVYSVAISPDANSVAVGGWTGYYEWGGHNIYVYNRQDGSIRHVIRGLPNAILHLTYAPDGKYLAATLGSSGLRVYETQSFTPVAEDRKYNSFSCWANFDNSGRLMTTSYDGFIRLYDENFVLIKKKQAPGGNGLYSAVFSPDGNSIAVGYNKSTRVDVLSVENLGLRFSADTSETKGDFGNVAWSQDGRYLYAGGAYGVAGKTLIRRWSDAGRGSYIELEAGSNTIMDMRPLFDGGLVVGTVGPIIAVLSADGMPVWKNIPEIADFRNQRDSNAIRLSSKGDRVRFAYDRYGKRVAQFSIKNWLFELDPPQDEQLASPLIQAPGLEITDWVNQNTPKLNGKPLALDEHETSRCLAIAPDNQRFLIGAEWTLRLFDRNGIQLWKVATPAIVRGINISGDGKIAVAALGNGMLRWYRMSDSTELLTFFPHSDGKRWIAWTPEGFYQASSGAEDLIGWHLNHGSNKAPSFYGASRFRDQFYRPEVVVRVLDTLDVEKALDLADLSRGIQSEIKDIKSILPPIITILSPAPGTLTESNKLVIFYDAV